MKRFFIFIMATLLIFSSFTFATENDSAYLYTNESGDLVVSGDLDYDDNSVLIDDPEDYDNLYNEANNLQEEYKNGFNTQRETYLNYTTDETQTNKLVITEVLSDIKSEYTTDYYNFYIIKYQNVRIKDEEGNETSAVVILSYDISDSKNIVPLKAGDTIYGYVEYTSSGEEAYNIVNHGLTDETIALVSINEKDRSLGTILLLILAILLLLLYVGKKGFKILVPLFVIIDLLFIVFIPLLENGMNIYLLASIISIELIILITVLSNGISRKTMVSLISSIIVVVLMVGLGFLFANTNNIIGTGIVSEESYDLNENLYYIDHVFKEVINTKGLYISIIMILVSVVTAVISSKLTTLSEKYAGTENMIGNIIEEAKGKLAGYIMIIATIFLVMNIPTVMLLVYNHVSFVALINSEKIITSISTLLITIISVLITSPVTAIISNLVMGNVEIKQIEDSKKSKK